jgi:hypothetical protein
VNVADSNFVNSNGAIVLSNYFEPVNGIDLRNATTSFQTGVVCLLFSCTGGEGVTLNLTGTTSLENLLVLNATSGGNMIQGTGTASILTGSAFTGLNLVNLANLNIVDSNYFLIALNAFRGITGDIVFPSLEGFFSALLSGALPGSLTLDSNAVVDNQIGFHTDTGGNQTDATSSAISTGSTLSLGNLLNQLNSNFIGGSNLAILLRVQGSWDGQIFSAPEGLSVLRGNDGSILLLSQGSGTGGMSGGVLNASSTAAIVNHIDLGAFTGANGIFGADSASITTGNALIGANILNLANQNIIGRNWLTAIINIFGDFNGNIAFGRPDLWIGERVEAPAPVENGSNLVFHFTIQNKGDAPATAASFAATLDAAHLTFSDPTSADLGTIAPGQSSEVVVHAKVNAPDGTDIATSGTVTGHEPDNNAGDNTDHLVIHVGAVSSGGGSSSSAGQSFVYPKPLGTTTAESLIVSRKTTSAIVGSTVRTVHEELTVTNPTDATSTSVDLHDLMKEPGGTVIHDEAWPLDTLAPHEEVTVTYDLNFEKDTPPGTYTLSTVLTTEAGDTEFRDNGSIFVLGLLPVVSTATHRPLSVTHTALVREVASTTPIVATTTAAHAPANPLIAAALSAHIPWTYALGFVLSAALLSGILWSALVLRRRMLG